MTSRIVIDPHQCWQSLVFSHKRKRRAKTNASLCSLIPGRDCSTVILSFLTIAERASVLTRVSTTDHKMLSQLSWWPDVGLNVRMLCALGPWKLALQRLSKSQDLEYVSGSRYCVFCCCFVDRSMVTDDSTIARRYNCSRTMCSVSSHAASLWKLNPTSEHVLSTCLL
jgi:hypothetical protein